MAIPRGTASTDGANIATACPICGKQSVSDLHSGLCYCDKCERMLGWLPGMRTYMIYGGSGVGKSALLYKMIELYLRNSMTCVYVALDEFPSQVKLNLKRFAKELGGFEAQGQMIFLDCYSCVGGVQSEEKNHITTPGDLNDLNIQLSSIIETSGADRQVRIFLDSITPLFTYRESSAVIKFLLTIGAKVKARGGSLFFTLGLGAISQEDQKKLELMADALVELKIDQSGSRPKRYFRVSKIRGAQFFDEWLPFYIGNQTIYVGLPEAPDQLERLRSAIQGFAPESAPAGTSQPAS
ncbi:MAG: hypothetical protein HYU39_00775 [Thaumarchaeota archaeon]|nr:hypothetical protein [Nitrososphaerota archaeon]